MGVVVPAVSTSGSKWVVAPEMSFPHWGSTQFLTGTAGPIFASIMSGLIWSIWGKMLPAKLVVKVKAMQMLPSNSRIALRESFTASPRRNNKIDKLMHFFRVCFFHVSQLESFLMSHSFPVMAADNLFAALEILFAWKYFFSPPFVWLTVHLFAEAWMWSVNIEKVRRKKSLKRSMGGGVSTTLTYFHSVEAPRKSWLSLSKTTTVLLYSGSMSFRYLVDHVCQHACSNCLHNWFHMSRQTALRRSRWR